MENKFPNTGRLTYSQRKIHPKSPDLYGRLVIERQYLKELLEATDEDSIHIKLDAWQYDGQNGTYFNLKVNTWKKPDENVSTPPPPPPVADEDLPF